MFVSNSDNVILNFILGSNHNLVFYLTSLFSISFIFRIHLGLGGAGHLLHLLQEPSVQLEAGALQLEAQLYACLFGDLHVLGDRLRKIGDLSPEAVLI